ncbi:MAG TPA: DNA primase [Desulfopila sp.]|nr:DNA primase [Desulfopila sp.]
MGFNQTRQDITATVKEQSDIVRIIGEHVELKRSGVRYLGLCPFHGEKTPSFSVHGSEQFFYCFGCSESGDVFSFLMKYHNYDFPTALKYLADRLNIQLPEKRVSPEERQRQSKQRLLYEVAGKAADIYRDSLLSGGLGEAARAYLQRRGMSTEAQQRFYIGYAPAKESVGWNFLGGRLTAEESALAVEIGLVVKKEDGGTYDRFRDRILFPIYDMQGRVCGFGGRIVGEGKPKYMNSPESDIYNKSKNLLGLYQQREEIRQKRKAVVVEGNFDLLALADRGCTNVVAPLGTALTAQQIRLVARYAEEVTLLFDGDAAGVKAAMRAAPLFLAEEVPARVALLPSGHDPDTYVREKGLEALQTLLDDASELSEFVLEGLMEEHGLSLEGKSRIARELKPLAAAASSSLQRSLIISHFAEKLKIEPARLEAAVSSSDIKREPAKRQTEVLKKPDASVLPVTPAQKRLVEFMVMQPCFFAELESGNLRQVLEGGVGEIIFLQVRKMVEQGSEIQPEDIFASLPEGPERALVEQILLEASRIEKYNGSETAQTELQELLQWLEMQTKRTLSTSLMVEIEQAQKENDFAKLEDLLRRKEALEREMRGD